MTRCLALNNPGSIRINPNVKWQGQAPEQPDPDFVAFTAPVYGIRAMARILIHYQTAGIDTIRAAINRWSPPSENDTSAYVTDVSRRTGIDPDAQISLTQNLPALIPAICYHEQGSWPYDADTLNQAINLAETA